jgi:hypothetical protein
MLALLAVLAVVALATTACGAGGGGDSGGAAADSGQSERDAGAVAETGVAAGDAGGDRSTRAAGASVQRRAVVATGTVELVGEDLAEAQEAVEGLTARNGGFVADREAVNDDEGRTTSATLRLRVPADRFGAVVAALEDLTTVTGVVTESEDVTTEVIDIDARIRTQQVSLRRLRGFLGRTDDVAELVRVEGEIARREASLRSLRAQQAYLADQTSLATLTVRMTTPETRATEKQPLTEGFGAGLAAGWRGLTTTFAVAATALGAALPFLAVLLVLGVPAWLLLRRRRPQASPVTDSAEG